MNTLTNLRRSMHTLEEAINRKSVSFCIKVNRYIWESIFVIVNVNAHLKYYQEACIFLYSTPSLLLPYLFDSTSESLRCAIYDYLPYISSIARA